MSIVHLFLEGLLCGLYQNSNKLCSAGYEDVAKAELGNILLVFRLRMILRNV